MPDHLSPEELVYHESLIQKRQDAATSVLHAKAALLDAQVAQGSAQQSMNIWLEHLGAKYGLKPQDLVHADGSFTLQDPGWALEAAAALQHEAVSAAALIPAEPLPSPTLTQDYL